MRTNLNNEECAALWQMSDDPKARNHALKLILRNNKGLLYGHFKRVVNKDMEEDFMQEAAIDLTREFIDKFDLSRGVKFYHFFKQALKKTVNRTNLKAKVVPAKQRKINGVQKFTDPQINSLNVRNEEGFELMDLLQAPPGEDMTQENVYTESLMAPLNKKEQIIVKHYYGLDCQPKTFDEIAPIVGLSRQRTWKIHQTALGKMKSYASQKSLSGDNLFNEMRDEYL